MSYDSLYTEVQQISLTEALVYSNHTRKQYTVKKITQTNKLMREVRIAKRTVNLKHQNLVRCVQIIREEDRHIIVNEWFQFGTL